MSILGTLDCKNKTIFGINKKSNTPLVLFKPADHNLSYFLVPSKLKNTNRNYYCVIKFSHNTPKHKFPVGTLLYSIGEVGNDIAEYEYLLHKRQLNRKEPQLSKNQMKKIRKKEFWDIVQKDEIKDYKDYRNIKTISIDPKDSTDIDDCLSYNNGIIGIHIADASFWIKKFKFQPDFYSTIYMPHRKINMLPRILSDNLASLLPNQDRLAFTFFYDTKSEKYWFEKTIIRNNKAYSYEEAEKNTNKFKELWEISKNLGKEYNIEGEWDTHKMVEAFMVFTNNKAAFYFRDNMQQHIYRNHLEKLHEFDLSKITNQKFRDFMNIYLSNSATYEQQLKQHYGLNLDYYTHFTSPIRRMADLLVHQIIKGEHIDNLSGFLDKCNHDIKESKRLQRDIEKFNTIKNIEKSITANGFIISTFENKITAYFPKIDFCDTFHIGTHLQNQDEIQQKISALNPLQEVRFTIGRKGKELVYYF